MLIGILVVLCVGTVLCIFATSLPLFVVGQALLGGSNITFGLALLIMRERLSGPTFAVCCGVISSINGGVVGVDALLRGTVIDHLRSSSTSANPNQTMPTLNRTAVSTPRTNGTPPRSVH